MRRMVAACLVAGGLVLAVGCSSSDDYSEFRQSLMDEGFSEETADCLVGVAKDNDVAAENIDDVETTPELQSGVAECMANVDISDLTVPDSTDG